MYVHVVSDKDFYKDDDIDICQLCNAETVKLLNSSSVKDGGRINVAISTLMIEKFILKIV